MSVSVCTYVVEHGATGTSRANRDEAAARRIVEVHADCELGSIKACRQGQLLRACAGAATPEASIFLACRCRVRACAGATAVSVTGGASRPGAGTEIIDRSSGGPGPARRLQGRDCGDVGWAEGLEVEPADVVGAFRQAVSTSRAGCVGGIAADACKIPRF